MAKRTRGDVRLRHWLAGLSLVFLLLSAYAARGIMGSLEHDIFLKVYSASDTWQPFAAVVTQLGNPILLLGLVGLLFVIKWRPDTALAVFWAGSIAYILAIFTKFLVSRPRPYELIEDFMARDAYVRGMGYPSSHVAFATAVSLTLVLYLPKPWRWAVVVPWITLVAWSRMYLGVHAPLDIVGGFLLGLMVYLACRQLPIWGIRGKAKRAAK